MGQFCDRMDADLQIRGLSTHTRRVYLACMGRFIQNVRRPADQVTLEDIRRYQLCLIRERKISPSKFNQIVCAIRFFYRVTLRKDWNIDHIPYQKTERKLPQIPSTEKIAAFLVSLENLKHRAILMTLYSGGLRVSEAVHLKVSDVDSQRMVLRIEQGKGRKDRYVMLSPRLLEALREYWKAYHPRTWLFPGRPSDKPIAQRSLCRIVKKAQQAAGLPGRFYPHLLRHSFATHLLENGANICVIQKLLGHRSLKSTQVYAQVAQNFLRGILSPLDSLPEPARAPLSRKNSLVTV